MDDEDKEYNSQILNPLKSKIRMFKFISFDIETYGKENRFLFGSVYDGQAFQMFYDREKMIDFFINNHFKDTYIVATNLGFDFNALFIGTKYYPDFEYILTNGKMIMAKWHMKKKDHKDCVNVFIDTMNFAGFSVYTLGKITKCPKLNTPVYIGQIPNKNKLAIIWVDEQYKKTKQLDIDEWTYYKEYNRRDSEISYKFMILMQEGINILGGQFKFTISSTALDIFRRSYMKSPFYKESLSINRNDLKKKIFEAYYGGRTEAFARGRIISKKLYDINSLYPWAMTQEFPDPSSAVYVDNPKEFVLEYFGILNCTVECQNMKYPLLPFRSKKLNKLIFPIGSFTGTWTILELNKAVSLGYKILSYNWAIIYKKTFYPFKEYVLDIYKKRMELKANGSSIEIIFKLFLNSLYGKFGQKDFIEIKFIDMKNITEAQHRLILDCDNMSVFEDLAYCTFKKESNSNFLFPIFCAYVTAYGRNKLYDYIKEYEADYCDTDSIVTSKVIKDSKELGEMKLECNIKEGVIVKPKFYRFNITDREILKVKGVHKVNKIMFDKILNKEAIHYNKFIKMKEAIKHKQIVNSIFEIEKMVGLEDNKRIWLNDFNPFIYDNKSMPYKLD